MIVTVRFYESEQLASDAAAKLVEGGFARDTILVVTPTPGSEAADVRAAIEKELLPGSYVRACTAALQQGRSVVAVQPPFGRAQIAVEILDEFGPVETETLPAYSRDNPAPLSETFGLPVLTRSSTPRLGVLTSSDFTLSSLFGMKLLSRNAAPLSSLFGMKTLSAPKKSWTSSMGLPLLSKNPTPLSSMIGWKPLTEEKPWKTSFGLPLLSKEAAPLSDFLGISVLSKKKKDRDADR